MKKLTKKNIESLAKEIIKYLKKYEMEDNVCIYYNNKRILLGSEWDKETGTFIPYEKVEEDKNPFDYFHFANPQHILSMSFEGGFYKSINYSGYKLKHFDTILNKYNLYYELGNAWNLSLYPVNDDMEIEYTDYSHKLEPEPITIYSHSTENDNIPYMLLHAKHYWDTLSKTTENLGGSFTIGDGFEFNFEDKSYFMNTPNIQGSLAYEYWIVHIKKFLEEIGATEVKYDYGRMD